MSEIKKDKKEGRSGNLTYRSLKMDTIKKKAKKEIRQKIDQLCVEGRQLVNACLGTDKQIHPTPAQRARMEEITKERRELQEALENL